MKTRTMSTRGWSALAARTGACLLWLGMACAQAADGKETYAVFSVVGDKLTVLSRLPSTGSNLDRTEREELAVSGRGIDNITLLAADDAIRATLAGAQPVLLASNDPALYELQDELFGGSARAIAARQKLQEQLRSAKATQMILITKYRADASMQLLDGRTGAGRVTGLGFYMERKSLIQHETGEAGDGYLAPYAYLRVSLVDVESMRVLREATAGESQVVMLKRSAQSFRLWDALEEKDKIRVLKRVIEASLAKAVPAALKS